MKMGFLEKRKSKYATKIDQIQQYCLNANTWVKFFCLLYAVMFLGVIVFSLINLFQPAKSLSLELLSNHKWLYSAEWSKGVNFFAMNLSAEDVRYSHEALANPKASYLINQFFGIVGASIFFMILILLSQILKTASSSHSPFIPQNVLRLKCIALLIAFGDPICEILLRIVLKVTGQVDAVNYNPFAFFASVGIGALIWLIALVFDYGCQLQQAADETL